MQAVRNGIICVMAWCASLATAAAQQDVPAKDPQAQGKEDIQSEAEGDRASRLTLKLKDRDLRDVVLSIKKKANVNIIMDAGIEATVTLGSRTVAGGVCLGVKGPDDLVALEVRNDGRVRVRVKRRGVWTDVGGVTLPSNPADRPVKLRMAVGGPVIRLEIAGMPAPDVPFAAAGLTPSDLDGSAGLMAESGEVRFESVDIRGR